MDDQRKKHLLAAQAKVPQSINCKDDILDLCNFLVRQGELTNLQLMEIRTEQTTIRQMTNVMIFLSERDDSAYDAFREGLFQIGAPKHVTDLLPDLKKQPFDSSQIQQSQSTTQSGESEPSQSSNDVHSSVSGDSEVSSSNQQDTTSPTSAKKSIPFRDPNKISLTEMERLELDLEKELRSKHHLSPAEQSFLNRRNSKPVQDKLDKFKQDVAAKSCWCSD